MFIFVCYRVTAQSNALRTMYDSYRAAQFPEANATKVPLTIPGAQIQRLSRRVSYITVAMNAIEFAGTLNDQASS
jgi:hypothetical protein